jgi:ferredoxin
MAGIFTHKEGPMAIPTTRTKENASISIDVKKCTGCGLCDTVCSDYNFVIENWKARLSDNPMFGCIGCGHCMAVCPKGAINIEGRTLSSGDLFELPQQKNSTTYSQLLTMLQRRRSIREFKDKKVEKDLIDIILAAAVTAPMGIRGSDVIVLVDDSSEKVRAFAEDYCLYLEGMKWFVSDWFLTMMRPFWGKANDELFRGFMKPMFTGFIDSMKKGINLVNYDAPLSMYFYGSPYCDPADPLIAATYAMLAAESLGLGTCMLGAIHPMIQSGGKAKKFRQKHDIKYKSREGLFVIFGYPAVKYNKGVKRTFASVTIK